MSCHGCGETFGFLKKEHGCPKCGFSYCKNCLRFKITDENSRKTLSVCHGCHTKSIDSSSSNPGERNKAKMEKSVGIMKAFHQLQSLENPDPPPIILYREDSNTRLGRLKKGLSVEDQKIVERLEGLRQSDFNINSHRRKSDNPEQEVASRLAKLRGEDPENPTTSFASTLPKKAPETEADLIERVRGEVHLDEKHNISMVADIEDRLARLRQPRIDNSTQSTDSVMQASGTQQMELESPYMENLSEEEQVKRIIEQFTKEVNLDSKLQTTIESDEVTLEDEKETSPDTIEMESDDEDDDVDVDLLCRICDETRAAVMCKECDNDIFCKKCFFEFHKEIGEVHKPKNM